MPYSMQCHTRCDAILNCCRLAPAAQLSPLLRILITRCVALVPTLFVALAYRGSARLDKLNQGLNLLQSIQLPFALIPVSKNDMQAQ